VSAEQKNGKMQQIIIVSKKGGIQKLKNPFQNYIYKKNGDVLLKNSSKQFIQLEFKPGATIILNAL